LKHWMYETYEMNVNGVHVVQPCMSNDTFQQVSMSKIAHNISENTACADHLEPDFVLPQQSPYDNALMLVHYTISEDRTGNQESVMKQRLAALGNHCWKKKIKPSHGSGDLQNQHIDAVREDEDKERIAHSGMNESEFLQPSPIQAGNTLQVCNHEVDLCNSCLTSWAGSIEHCQA